MSGILGIADFSGEPVDGAQLRDLTDQLKFRGPDHQQVWHDGAVGFGHARLASTVESGNDHQPLSVGSDVWIVADARIDDQATLIHALRSQGTVIEKGVSDAELILRAYLVWGADCVEHLMGDFVFGIWDARQRRLMLARDHFGVAPMYYARLGSRVIFGNTLDVLRKYPGIRDDLNEEAIGDYLLFGYSIDLNNTFFTQIRALPPASRIVWDNGNDARPQRYWSLPEPDSYHRIRSVADYGAEFKAVFTDAVRDRLRSRRAAISLSGGLDSGAVAAIAGALLREGSSRTELHAYSSGHDWMVPETERYYAGLTANASGIPTTYISIEQSVFDGKSLWRSIPEPRLNGARRSSYTEINRQMAVNGEPVLFTGMGGDGIVGPSPVDWRKYFQSGSLKATAQALMFYSREQRWLPVNRILATMMRPVRSRAPDLTDLSRLDPDFVRRANLPARVEKMRLLKAQWRTEQQRMAYDPFWNAVISQGDGEYTKRPAKTYHPFFDLRVLQFATRTSPLPWFVDKLLLREAMRGILPETIRKRRKTKGRLSALRALVPHGMYAEAEEWAKIPALSRYINQQQLLQHLASIREGKPRSNDRRVNGLKEIELPLCLGFWFKSAFS